MAKIKQLTDVATNEEIFPISYAQGIFRKSGTETVEDSLNKKLDKVALNGAVDDALAKAKASGDFKGDPGADGNDGAPGADGISVTHSWEGTKLTLTSKSGTTITDLKGQDGKNGQDGSPGAAAGFGKPTASITGGVGTPSVSVTTSGSNTAKVFNFNFKNLKGETGNTGRGISKVEKITNNTSSSENNTIQVTYTDNGTDTFTVQNGAMGAAAGFGTPTASVTNNTVGTPSVKITSSGPNIAKIFDFKFSNLKGQVGATGNGIASITATDNKGSGATNTVTINYTNGGNKTFNVYNGKDGTTGPQGPKGERGLGFKIYKIYDSVALMNQDYANTNSTIPVGGFVLVGTEKTSAGEHGRLYVKTESKFEFVVDMSGAQGIQGPKGNGIKEVKQVTTSNQSEGINTIEFTQDNGTVTNFNVKNGQRGEKGKAGIDGESTAATAWSQEKCVDFCTRASVVTWSDSEIQNGKTGKVAWQTGNKIILVIPCQNGDYYTSIQNVIDSGSLRPTGVYWISKKGDKGDTPKKGVDYFTSAEINDIATQAAGKVSKTSIGLDKVNNTLDSEKNVKYAETAGSAKANDVYPWAKAKDKPIYGANEIKFTDGKTFQQKLDEGTLKGEQGIQGAVGSTGPKGDSGRAIFWGSLTDLTQVSDTHQTIASMIKNRTRIAATVKNANIFKKGDIAILPGQYNDSPRQHYIILFEIDKIVNGQLQGYPLYVIEEGLPGAKGETGKQGPAGSNGTSVTHSWSGTTLNLTSASGSTSTNLVGATGNGIASITATDNKGSGAANTITVKYTNGDSKIFNVYNGKDGKDGGIGQQGPRGNRGASVNKVALTGGSTTAGQTTTYSLYNEDSSSSPIGSFNVYNGKNGNDGQSAIISNVTASINNEAGTPNVNITMGGSSLNRTFNFDFTGLKGQQGDIGAPGLQGPKGDIPVKGQDYFTESDKTELVTQVTNELNLFWQSF